MFPRTDAIKVALRHQFRKHGPCGDNNIDATSVSIDFTKFSGLHSTYLLELKCQYAYIGTYGY